MSRERPFDFGGRLRSARERRAITLNQIAAATKISRGALEALERNDLARLPGGLFTRGFVRAYAAHVGLDPEETVEDFMSSFPDDGAAGYPRPDRIEDAEALESDRQTAATFLRLVAFSVPAAALLLYFSTARSSPPPTPARSPVVAAAAADRPAVSAPAAPAAHDQPVSSAGVNARAASPPSVDTSDAQARAAATAGALQQSDAHALLAVVLKASAPCWISVTADGRRVTERLLRTGEAESVEATRELDLTAGDAAALRMIINGAAARALGRPSQVVTVHVTPANFKSYLATR